MHQPKTFVLHLIKTGQDLYKGGQHENNWMIWHDALSIIWDQETQAWLCTLKCPIEGWQDQTWADNFICFCGKYNDMVSVHYNNTLPRDSPELMPLDCHLFSEIKEGVAQNIAL